VMLERLEKRPRTAPAAFSPPTFACTASVLWFHVSPSSPRGNASGGLYIGFFRSGQSIWYEDGWHQSHDGQTDIGELA
jgi:hypothetical protein